MPTSDTTVQWFLARDGKPHGPMTAEEMAKIVELGHLRDSDLVWRPGFAEWLPAPQVFPAEPQEAQLPPPGGAPPAAPEPSIAELMAVEQARRGPVRIDAAGAVAAPRRPQSAAAGDGGWVMPEQPLSQPRGPILGPAGGFDGGAVHQHQPGPLAAPGGPRGDHRRPQPEGPQSAPRRPVAREPEPRSRAGLWLGAGLIALAVAALAGFLAYQRLAAGAPQAANATGSAAKAPPAPVKAVAPPAKPAPLLPVEGIDTEMQAAPLWQLLKSEFPEWYAARLQDIARLRADRKDEYAVAKHLAEQIVLLRRQFTLHALAASHAKLKRVAEAFYANLAGLAKHSPEACFGFISLGEMSPVVLKLQRSPEYKAHLDAQVMSVVEAIVDGRRQPQSHGSPTEQDYNTLSRELRSRGWTDVDLQLFADARELSQAPPERVCKMVQDWFAGQLAVKDPAVQLRLLVEALRPIVAG